LIKKEIFALGNLDLWLVDIFNKVQVKFTSKANLYKNDFFVSQKFKTCVNCIIIFSTIYFDSCLTQSQQCISLKGTIYILRSDQVAEVCEWTCEKGHQECLHSKNNDSFGQQTDKKCWAFRRKQVFCWWSSIFVTMLFKVDQNLQLWTKRSQ
jgi:hypothetical protein